MLHSTKTLRRLAHKRDDQGFTLIELMVVVLIIGILVGIAVLAFGTAQSTSRNSRAQANLRSVQSIAAVAVARGTATSLSAVTAANIASEGEPNLVTTAGTQPPASGQAWSSTGGLFCAQGNDASTIYVLSLGATVPRYVAATCTSVATSTIW